MHARSQKNYGGKGYSSPSPSAERPGPGNSPIPDKKGGNGNRERFEEGRYENEGGHVQASNQSGPANQKNEEQDRNRQQTPTGQTGDSKTKAINQAPRDSSSSQNPDRGYVDKDSQEGDGNDFSRSRRSRERESADPGR